MKFNVTKGECFALVVSAKAVLVRVALRRGNCTKTRNISVKRQIDKQTGKQTVTRTNRNRERDR